MKKLALIITVMFVMATLFSTLSFAVELPLRVVVNGNKLTFPDAQPFVDGNGRTQTPARFIGEALGANVTWDGSKQKAVFELGSNTLVLYIGKTDYDLNGQKKQMDTAAMLKDGRTFVPARYVAEAFGATVRWDSAIRTVYIEITKVPTPTSGTHNVSGFVVPNGIDLGASAAEIDEPVETHFIIDFLRKDVEKQKDDLEKILKQKLDANTVKQIMDCIRPKIKATDTIEEKNFYDKKTGQYIYLPKSWPMDYSTIELYIYKKGVNPNQ